MSGWADMRKRCGSTSHNHDWRAFSFGEKEENHECGTRELSYTWVGRDAVCQRWVC